MSIEVRRVLKRFGAFQALDDVSLHVEGGSLTALLGPSGSGKSTLLRIIAGLETPDAGDVLISGELATAVKPQKRNVGFVFQHYAAFKHMTVRDNVAFGLKVRKRPKDEVGDRVALLLELVQLEAFGDRYPSQLSGGQRQRMALARALAPEPEVLLLDEPFGALDARVRAELRDWLRRLHEEVHVTTIFVTHDQAEAMDVASQIAVLNAGRIEQVGTPSEVYERPETEFVAGFVGVSNVLERNGRRFTVRPEKIRLLPPDAAGGEAGVIADAVYAGAITRYTVELDAGGRLQVVEQNLETTSADVSAARGQRVKLHWSQDRLMYLKRTSSRPKLSCRIRRPSG